MKQLSSEQRELLTELVGRLGALDGIRAVALGGSHARGRARPESDIDLYLYYTESAPFSIDRLRALAAALDDGPEPVVTDFYGWGPWVNGGAWLTIGGRRVDFVYRSLEHVARVVAEAEAGRYALDYAQQPPFGFFGPAYLGELAVYGPLFDPEERFAALRRRVAVYPEALRAAIVQDALWQAELGLAAFAPKFANRSGAYGTAACLTRTVHQLLLALFALNRQYFMDDKTALAEAAGFARGPVDFERRVQRMFAALGSEAAAHTAAVEIAAQLFRETAALAEDLYRPRFILPVNADRRED